MDGFKKTRKAVRTTFTRTYTTLTGLLNQDAPNTQEVRTQFALLKDKAGELEEWNAKIIEVMQNAEGITDEDLVRKLEIQDEYKVKYLEVKHDVLDLLEPPINNPLPAQNLLAQNITQMNQTLLESKRFKLPKIDPPKFSGDLKEWLQFWGLFKSIHEDDTITKEQKFSYLVQAMVEGSRARELVDSFPPTADNYDKAITSLKNRFGKEEILVEMYIRELLKLVLNNAVSKTEKKKLSSIYDKLKTQLRALESLGVTTDMCAAMLYPLVQSSLPEELLRVWQRHSTTLAIPDAQARLTKFMDFLEAEVESEQRIDIAVEGFGLPSDNTKEKQKRKVKSETKAVPTGAGLLTTKEPAKLTCIFCDAAHASETCEKAKKMSFAERVEVVKQKNACYYCLKTNHSCKFCRYREKCAWCGKKHVLLMCREMNPVAVADDKTKPPVTEHSLASIANEPEVFLQTLRVKLVNNEKELEVRTIIDSGAHRSYISSQVAEAMGYKVAQSRTLVHSLFGGTVTQPEEHSIYKIHLRSLDGSFACNFLACEQDTICKNLPKIKRGPWIDELRQKSIQLTGVGIGQHPIGLLIGGDVANKLLTGKMIHLSCGATAISTQLGWTLLGKAAGTLNVDTALVNFCMFVQDAKIEELWKLDVIGIEDPIERKSKADHEKEVLNRFIETTTVNEEKRFEVVLPWKENHPSLTDNRAIAEARLQKTLRTLESRRLLEDYQRVLDEWLEEGIIERVPENEIPRTSYYMPHYPVLKEGSTTRLRPVFNASARCKGGPSLNECLESGPNLIELIPTLITQFRAKHTGITADIRKAFLQVSVAPSERDFLRFLWIATEDASKRIVYRHRRVVFGVTSSPFTLAAIILLLIDGALKSAKTERERRILHRLRDSFYGDNCVTSVDSLEEAKEFQAVATRVFEAAGFDLRA